MLLACNLRVGTHFKLVKKKRQKFFVWKKTAEKLGFRLQHYYKGAVPALPPFQMLLTTPLLFTVDNVNMRIGVISANAYAVSRVDVNKKPTRDIYLERGERNRNRVPFQIFCVPTRPIAKLRTYRDFDKRSPPFKFLNGSLGHTEDTRVRISCGHCDWGLAFLGPFAERTPFGIFCVTTSPDAKHAQVDNLIRGHHHLNIASGLVVTRKIRARKWRH